MNDEIGYLAQGMNNMTEKLQGHIKKVYIAEIRQREAEIEALKTQIQPIIFIILWMLSE